jgi:4-hydroxy-4-methyl-2-oxoglutarate aldolase
VSLGGGTKLSRAHNHGLAGILADGALRDFDELAGYDLAIYCRREATRAGVDIVMPYLANVPVALGGVTIVPGDYLYVDSSGGVVIPSAHLDSVVAGARAAEEEDARARDRIRTERL